MPPLKFGAACTKGLKEHRDQAGKPSEQFLLSLRLASGSGLK
jgi:hypothetical protein